MSYVLVVDDNTVMAEALADMVRVLDWPAQVAQGPRAALQALQRAQPALILLDLRMHGIDGIEVLKYIKRDPMYGQIPVVFVTAEDDPDVEEKTRAAGASDYLVKPVEVDRLEALLSTIKKPGPGTSSDPTRLPPPAP